MPSLPCPARSTSSNAPTPPAVLRCSTPPPLSTLRSQKFVPVCAPPPLCSCIDVKQMHRIYCLRRSCQHQRNDLHQRKHCLHISRPRRAASEHLGHICGPSCAGAVEAVDASHCPSSRRYTERNVTRRLFHNGKVLDWPPYLHVPDVPQPSQLQLARSQKGLTVKIPSHQSIGAILSPYQPSESPGSVDSAKTKRSHIEAFETESDAFLRPTSPLDKRFEPSTPATDSSLRVANEDAETIKQQVEGYKLPKMRSSIACTRCRRSKVKCVNNGMNTICRTCETQGRECTYPTPSAGPGSIPKRTEAPGGTRPDGEVEIKRARKKEPDISGKGSFRSSDDPFETPPITFRQWEDIYKLFLLHFSTDLPFLHEATFFDRISAPQESWAPGTQVLLLGVLSLTARFVPELVANVNFPALRSSPSRYGDAKKEDLKIGHPLYASEFYARALEDRLDAVTMATPSLDTIQALLMLGLYSWGMCKGPRSWMWVGIATRMAYALGLGSEEVLESNDVQDARIQSEIQDEIKRLGVTKKPKPAFDTQSLVTREIKRRTMWSCFMLDRYLAIGESRPQMSVPTELQLPCSEEDFRFGSNVKTDFLKPGGGVQKNSDSSGNGQVETSPVLGLYIRLVEIMGGISKWSCSGGRRREGQLPPWDKRSDFAKLRRQLDEWHAALPPKITFTPSNLAAHVGGSAMSVYSTIHTTYHLCQIILHREYIPFIALQCQNGPSGPIDAPAYPPDKYQIPSGFWEDSAELIFQSARSIIDIIKANRSRKYLIEAPQIMFAIYTAAFTGIYARHFPWMDTGRHMVGSPDPDGDIGSNGHQPDVCSLAFEALGQISQKMIMAHHWYKIAGRLNKYFGAIRHNHDQAQKKDAFSSYAQHGNAHHGDAQLLLDVRNRTLREGGTGMGGGLAVYKHVEKLLKEFGPIDFDDAPSLFDVYDLRSSRASTSGPSMTPVIKSEVLPGLDRTPIGRPNSEGSWAAVNTGVNGADINGQRAPISYPSIGPTSYTEYGFSGRGSNIPSILNGQIPHPTQSMSVPLGRPDFHPSDSAYPNDAHQHSQQPIGPHQSPGSFQQAQPTSAGMQTESSYDPNHVFPADFTPTEVYHWGAGDLKLQMYGDFNQRWFDDQDFMGQLNPQFL